VKSPVNEHTAQSVFNVTLTCPITKGSGRMRERLLKLVTNCCLKDIGSKGRKNRVDGGLLATSHGERGRSCGLGGSVLKKLDQGKVQVEKGGRGGGEGRSWVITSREQYTTVGGEMVHLGIKQRQLSYCKESCPMVCPAGQTGGGTETE